ncbi:Cof-type HAD-IIB family hydrolase [Alkalibacterium sp. AK22]|uniref:Cof-type HAD-IIB family hydrolase n=1 Tax=Alkalibacterium sp. AK22 TaxID=1229520 RepID=UPI0022AFD1F1|nr:Cof-type HAD-IIB family hydrolase [Alkalibacterium sp. AK22]
MTEKKLFVFDIDGTLLDEDKQLPESTKEALDRLSATHEVAIATGRNRTMAKEVIQALSVDHYIVCNGAAAYSQHKQVYSNPLNKNELKKLIELSDSNGHQMVYETVDELRRRDAVAGHRLSTGMKDVGFPVPVHDREYHHFQELVQCLLFYKEEEAYIYEENLFQNYRFVRWHEYGVDVLPVNGSKFHTIERLAKYLNYKIDQVVAFGDGLNDLEMIGHAGLGIAMGNAEAEVKAAADMVTAKNTEHGIYLALKELKAI